MTPTIDRKELLKEEREASKSAEEVEENEEDA
jgi:hypothetical protein